MTELYIGGVKADIGDDTDLAFTLQANDVTKPESIQSNFSQPFNLPYTETNQALAGYADEANSNSTRPYSRLDAQVIRDGVELVPFGLAQLNAFRSDTRQFEWQVFSGNIDFFDKLGDKSIRSLNLTAFDHLWNGTSIINSISHFYQQGYVYDIIDRGKDGQATGTRLEDFFPSTFVRVIWDRIFSEAGFTYQWADKPAWFDLLILPFVESQPVHPESWVTARSSNAISTSNQLFTTSDNLRVKFQNDSVLPGYDGSLNCWRVVDPVFGVPENRYVADGIRLLNIEINLTATAPPGNGTSVSLVLLQGGNFATVPIELETFSVAPGQTKDWVIQVREVNTTPGNLFYIEARLPGTTNTVTVHAGSSIKVIPQNVVLFDQLFGDTWSLAPNLPDLKQKDFIKFFIQKFQLICQVDLYTNVVKLTGFPKLLDNINAGVFRDWSNKLVPRAADSITRFRYGAFGQKSKIIWKVQDGGTAGFADGFLPVADQTLPAEVDIIKFPFAATEMTKGVGGQLIPRILMFSPQPKEEGVERKYNRVKSEPRILIRQNVNLPAYLYIGALAQPVTPFSPISRFLPELDIQNNIIEQYFGTTKALLTQTRLLQERLLLDEQDIADLDFTVPVWIEWHQAFFYVNRINQYQGSETPCLVELLKL